MHSRNRRRDAGVEFLELELDNETDVETTEFRGETTAESGGITPGSGGGEGDSLHASDDTGT